MNNMLGFGCTNSSGNMGNTLQDLLQKLIEREIMKPPGIYANFLNVSFVLFRASNSTLS